MDQKKKSNKQFDAEKDNLEGKGRREMLKTTLTGVAGGAAALMLGGTLKPNDAHAETQDFLDFAYRITVPHDGDLGNELAIEFMGILARVNPGQESVWRVIKPLQQFFEKNQYVVTEEQCRQILEFHKKYPEYLKNPANQVRNY